MLLSAWIAVPSMAAGAGAGAGVGRSRMPAEWEPHEAVFIGWPLRTDTWRHGAKPAQAAFARLAAILARFERVVVVVDAAAGPGAEAAEAARKAKEAAEAAVRQAVKDDEDKEHTRHHPVEVVAFPCNDAWLRDTGPTFVVGDDGSLAAVQWRFNAWGGLYKDTSRDAELPRHMAAHMGATVVDERLLTLEGGAIHVDGAGHLLATTSSVFAENRENADVEHMVSRLFDVRLGVVDTVWLPSGLSTDVDTDGHIDVIAAFTPTPRSVLLAHDEEEPATAEAEDVLRGKGFDVVRVPLPPPTGFARPWTAEEVAGLEPSADSVPDERQVGQPLAASYMNFLVVNGGVVMPSFGMEDLDAKAAAVLGAAHPRRRVVMLEAEHCRELLLGGGSIHCVTQQVPRVTPPRAAVHEPAATRGDSVGPEG